VLISTAAPVIRKLILPLHSTDRLLLSFWCLLSLVGFVFQARIANWLPLILADLAACFLVCIIAWADRAKCTRTLRWVHDWAAFALVVFTYKQVYFMVRPIHQWRDYDRLLIALDQWLFRVNPTEWLAGFANPWLTELLQIAYALFYLFFVAIGLELYLRKDLSPFRHFSFTVVYGFFLSYLGYFFLPAAGPRFTLYDFSKTDSELPGVLVTPALRWFVNIWESIPAGVSNAVALANAQRDVFPSGHTMMTIVAVTLAYRYGLKVRHWACGVGILLICATVYLRYHYAIDLIAGALLAFYCLLTSRKVYKAIGGR
jgi:membrane-associated phospholipid phosphatase